MTRPQDDSSDFFKHAPTVLDRESLGRTIRSIFDYRCVVSGGERIFIIGIGVS